MKKKWEKDPDYMDIISDLLEQKAVKKLEDFSQHHNGTRLEHSLRVSYDSYRVAKRLNLDSRSTARAALLHDLFYYDWRVTKFNTGTHSYVHPRMALRNAERLTDLNDKEVDIIIKHMWGATKSRPKYLESLLVSLVDNFASVKEYLDHLKNNAVKRLYPRY